MLRAEKGAGRPFRLFSKVFQKDVGPERDSGGVNLPDTALLLQVLYDRSNVLRQPGIVKRRSHVFRSTAVPCIHTNGVEPRRISFFAHAQEVMGGGAPLAAMKQKQCWRVKPFARLPG